jgi:hypothetical protein
MDSLKSAFNWLAQRPAHNYTLGELFQHYVQGRPWQAVEDNSLGFTRAGRAWERAHTALGALYLGAAVISGAPELVAAGAGVLACEKALGILTGKVVDYIVRSGAGTLPSPFLHRMVAADYRESRAIARGKGGPQP